MDDSALTMSGASRKNYTSKKQVKKAQSGPSIATLFKRQQDVECDINKKKTVDEVDSGEENEYENDSRESDYACDDEKDHSTSNDLRSKGEKRALSEDFGNDSRTESQPKKKQKSAKAGLGAAKYKCQFQSEWKTTYPFISESSLGKHFFRCNVCVVDRSCGHQGKYDVKRHVNGQAHLDAVKNRERAPMNKHVMREKPSDMSDAEYKVCNNSF